MKLKYKMLYIVMWSENEIDYEYNYFDFIHAWRKAQSLIDKKIPVMYSVFSISNGKVPVLFADFVEPNYVYKNMKNFVGSFTLKKKESWTFDWWL